MINFFYAFTGNKLFYISRYAIKKISQDIKCKQCIKTVHKKTFIIN